jgi:hypothetical protein
MVVSGYVYRPDMEQEEIEAYVDAVMVEFMPVLRDAVDTWARLGVEVPTPKELIDALMEEAFGRSDATDAGQ